MEKPKNIWVWSMLVPVLAAVILPFMLAGGLQLGGMVYGAVLGIQRVNDQNQARTARSSEILAAQITAAHDYERDALDNMFLLNGGAVVGILTFLGHFLSSGNPERMKIGMSLTRRVLPAIGCYCMGLAFVVLCTAGQHRGMIRLVRGENHSTTSAIDNLYTMVLLNGSLAYFVAATAITAFALNEACRPE